MYWWSSYAYWLEKYLSIQYPCNQKWGWQAEPQRDLFLQFTGSIIRIHLRLTPAIPCNQKWGWQAELRRALFLQFTGSITRIHLRLTPTIPMQSKMWLAGGTSTCSLPSVHGVDNTHTSTLDTYNTHAIKNVAGRRNFNVLSSFSSRGR